MVLWPFGPLALCPFLLFPFFLCLARARSARDIFSDFGWAEWLAREWLCSVTGVLRGGSWGNNDPRNLRCSNRNNDASDNRNDNVGFRCVVVGVGGVRKVPGRRQPPTARYGVGNSSAPSVPRGHLTCTPTPRGRGENTRRRAVAGNGCHPDSVCESHGPLFFPIVGRDALRASVTFPRMRSISPMPWISPRPLECGDLSPLSRGDWSPSGGGRRPVARGRRAARASGGTRAGTDTRRTLTATSRLCESGDESSHSKPAARGAREHGARRPANLQAGRLRYPARGPISVGRDALRASVTFPRGTFDLDGEEENHRRSGTGQVRAGR